MRWYNVIGAIPTRECAQCRAKHRSISHASSVQVLRSRRSLYRLAHNRRRRRAPITGGSASHCRIVTISTPCIAGLPLRRPRPCLTRRNTAFFAGCRRTRSEGRVIHSCRASVFSGAPETIFGSQRISQGLGGFLSALLGSPEIRHHGSQHRR